MNVNVNPNDLISSRTTSSFRKKKTASSKSGVSRRTVPPVQRSASVSATPVQGQTSLFNTGATTMDEFPRAGLFAATVSGSFDGSENGATSATGSDYSDSLKELSNLNLQGRQETSETETSLPQQGASDLRTTATFRNFSGNENFPMDDSFSDMDSIRSSHSMSDILHSSRGLDGSFFGENNLRPDPSELLSSNRPKKDKFRKRRSRKDSRNKQTNLNNNQRAATADNHTYTDSKGESDTEDEEVSPVRDFPDTDQLVSENSTAGNGGQEFASAGLFWGNGNTQDDEETSKSAEEDYNDISMSNNSRASDNSYHSACSGDHNHTEEIDIMNEMLKKVRVDEQSKNDDKAAAGTSGEEGSKASSNKTEATSQKLQEEQRKKVTELRKAAKELYQSHDFAASYHRYSELISLQKENPLHWCNRAAARMKLDDMDGATADCYQATALDPSFVKAYLRSAQAFAKLGDYQSSLRQYELGKDAAKSCKEYGIGPNSCLREVLKEHIQCSKNRATKEQEEEQLQAAARTQGCLLLDEAEDGIKRLSAFEVRALCPIVNKC